MSEDAVWTKIDLHEQRLQDLAKAQAAHEKQLTMLQHELHRMNKDMGSQHGEVMAKLNALVNDQNKLSQEQHRRAGREEVTKWLVPVLLSLLMVVVTYQTLL